HDGPREDRARVARRSYDDLSTRQSRNADELRPLACLRVAATRARARFGERLQAEAQAVAVAADGDGVHAWLGPFLPRLDLTGDARIETQRRQDPLTVLQLEEALDRLAVSGGRRDIGKASRGGDAAVAEEHRHRPRAPRERREHLISFAQPRGRDVLHFLLTFDPSIPR